MSGLNPLIFHPFLSVLSSVPSQKYFQLVIWTFSLHIFAISANSPSSSLLDNTCENAYPVQRGISYAKQARTERSPAPASMLISLCLYQYATDQTDIGALTWVSEGKPEPLPGAGPEAVPSAGAHMDVPYSRWDRPPHNDRSGCICPNQSLPHILFA